MTDPAMLTAMGVILVGDLNLLIAYIVSIRSKFHDNLRERRSFLDSDFLSKVNDPKKADAKITDFLPLFKEHEKIEDWKERIEEVYQLIGWSVLFTIAGFVASLLNVGPFQGVASWEAILLIIGGLFLGAVILRLISLDNEMRKWKVSCEETRKKPETPSIL